MDIRLYTCLVIRKHGRYLVGRILGSSDLRWSDSIYDAYRTRDREKAEALARKVGGVMVLFNPVAGQKKTIGT